MSKFLMCLQEFTVQAVIVTHIVSHVIKCEELDENRMKMAFGHRSNLLHIVSEFGEMVNFFAVKHQMRRKCIGLIFDQMCRRNEIHRMGDFIGEKIGFSIAETIP